MLLRYTDCKDCNDPWRNQCFLVYPIRGDKSPSCGPFNQLRGKNLLAKYQKYHDLTDRIMLVDADLHSFFMEDPMQCANNIPPGLGAEIDNFAKGCIPGPCMNQEHQYMRLSQTNTILKRKITQKTLNAIHHQIHKDANNGFYCYCHEAMPKKGLPNGVVECSYIDCSARYFHRSCAKDMGLDMQSKWYCGDCQLMMQKRASVAMNLRTITDILQEDTEDMTGMPGTPKGLVDELQVRFVQCEENHGPQDFQLNASVAIARHSISREPANMECRDFRALIRIA